MTPIEEAIEATAAQLSALDASDLDAFLDGVDGHEQCCARAAADAGPADAGGLQELVAANALLARRLDQTRTAAGARLAAMQRGRTASAAYLETLPREMTSRRAG